jgi:hypothetical protein
MTFADQLNRWNRWYDSTPENWRGHILAWPLVAIGFLNMQLTIAGGFPFGLLLLLGLLAIAAVRLPYTRGWIKPADGAENADAPGARIVVGRIDWLYDLNLSYDALPTTRRIWVVPAILIVVGAVNMKLTLANGYPFGLLFLLALLAVIAVRAPFVAGMVTPPPEQREAPLLPRWLAGLNARYDSLPRERRFWTLLAAVLVIGAINLDLTLASGMPFGLLFLIVFLLIVAVRTPYVTGWTSRHLLAAPAAQLTHAHDEPVAIPPADVVRSQQHLEPAGTVEPSAGDEGT